MNKDTRERPLKGNSMIDFKRMLNLQLFADGGAEGAAAATADGAETAETNEDVQTADAQTETRDFDAEFDNLIKGDFKDAFSKRMQAIIDKRFKKAKQIETDYNNLNSVISDIAAATGKDATDINGIKEAVMDKILEDRALTEGKSADELKKDIKLKKYEDADKQRATADENRRKVASWAAESRKLADTFPGLNLSKELNNPEFMSDLEDFTKRGVKNPVERAYRYAHNDEIITGAVAKAVEKATKAATDKIVSGQNRPKENGNSSSAGVKTSTDVNNLTGQQIRDIIKRVERGERIELSNLP